MTRVPRAPRRSLGAQAGSRSRGASAPSDKTWAQQTRRRAAAARRPRFTSPHLIFVFAAVVLIGLVVAAALALSFGWLSAILLGVNAATLLLYGYDKAIAGRGRLRIPESVLHGLALLGGTPAAFVSQRWFRHKVSKPAFQRVFVATAIAQGALVMAWAWWTRSG